MSRRTAHEITAEIAANIGDQDHNKIPLADLLRYANDAQIDITVLHEPSECTSSIAFTTTPGERDYEDGNEFIIPESRTPLLKVLSFVNSTTGVRMLEVDDAWYRAVTAGGVDTGAPTHWYAFVKHGYFRLWPTPDNAYEVYFSFLAAPHELTLTPNPNMSHLMPAWDDVIVALATARAFRRLQEWDAATIWKREALEASARIHSGVTTLNSEPWAIGARRMMDL